jgi:hypothetical protein
MTWRPEALLGPRIRKVVAERRIERGAFVALDRRLAA